METSDITVQILRDIRDEISSTKTELRDELRALGGRVDHMESHLGAEIVGLRADFVVVRDMLVERRDIRHRVEACERDIADLKRRVP